MSYKWVSPTELNKYLAIKQRNGHSHSLSRLKERLITADIRQHSLAQQPRLMSTKKYADKKLNWLLFIYLDYITK